MTKNNVTLKDIYEAINDLRNEISAKYVTKEEFEPVKVNYVTQAEFWPVRTIVYSGAGIVLVAVFSALVYLVVEGRL